MGDTNWRQTLALDAGEAACDLLDRSAILHTARRSEVITTHTAIGIHAARRANPALFRPAADSSRRVKYQAKAETPSWPPPAPSLARSHPKSLHRIDRRTGAVFRDC